MTLNNETQEDLRLTYSISVDDIRFAKRQQWQITYYALILLAGIFYLMTFHQISFWWEFILRVLMGVIAFSAIVFIIRIENDMVGYRSRMLQAQRCLSAEFKKLHPKPRNYTNVWFTVWEIGISKWKKKITINISVYKWEFLLIQIATVYLAAFTLLWLYPLERLSF